jgi:hypothetical protein
MLGPALVALMGAVIPPALQDTGTVDAPVYEDVSYGVSIPRPFDDWVFEPGVGRRTTTVIFHPRTSPLREQFWGALVLTSFPGQVPLGQVADQRVQVAWRPQLGPGFTLLTRDSLAVAGLPAIHVVMSGAINHVVVDAEEYVVARDGDLIVLQFRYPRGLPRDSVGAGYQRVLNGLRIRRALPAPELAMPSPVLVDSIATERTLAWSSWEARAYDAVVRYDTAQLRADISVRVDLVNDGPVSAESLTVWLWPAFVLDSVRSAAGRIAPNTAGSVSRLALPDEVQSQASAAVTFFYHVAAASGRHLPASHIGLGVHGAYVATDWLPRVQPALDSAGQLVATVRPRYTLRFDVPVSWRAVAPGRLTSDLTSVDRRRVTWVSGDVTVGIPAFALGPYRVDMRRAPGLSVALWIGPADTVSASAVDSLAASVRAAWVFCSRVFGRLPSAGVNVAITDLRVVRGFAGLVLVGHTADSSGRWFTRDELFRETARSWWGNSMSVTGAGSAWLVEGIPAWVAIAARGVLEGDTVRQRLVREAEAAWRSAAGGGDPPLSSVGISDPRVGMLRSKGAAALEAARRAVGDPRFREALLTLALEHRNGWATLDDLFASLGPDGAAVLRPFLF